MTLDPDSGDDYASDIAVASVNASASHRRPGAGFRLPVGECPGTAEFMLGGVLAWSSIIETIVAREGVRA